MPTLRQLALQTRSTVLSPWRNRRLGQRCQVGLAPMSVLFYHRVADSYPNPWTISRDDFVRHLDYCQARCELVGLDTVQQRVDLGVSHRPTVTITFDDGYAENCDFALPLLIERKIPTVYFTTTQNVIHQRPFEHDVAAGQALPVNTCQQIRELADAGIEIGLHTRNHVDFSKVNDPQVIADEIVHGKRELEDMIGREVRYLAVPFGLPQHLTAQVIKATRAAGLQGFCSAFGAYNVPGRDHFHIRRIHGDPGLARLTNWLSFDARKDNAEPSLQLLGNYQSRAEEPGDEDSGDVEADAKAKQTSSSVTTNRQLPLRCLFVITSMPVGGAETLLVNLMRQMDSDRIRPEVVCLKDRGPLGDEISNEFPVHHDILGSKWDVRVLFRLIRLMKHRKIDAVITVGAGDKMFWGRLAGWLAGVPMVASALHSTGWPDGVGKLNRLLTSITDKFIAVADSHGRFLHEFEKFPQAKVEVIRNGIDCDRFKSDSTARELIRSELGLKQSDHVIGIVAALRPEKNHPLLIQCAARLRHRFPKAHWLIVGDGPERPALEALCVQLDVVDCVHFMGTRHDTPNILAAMDVFALCSLNEASPVSILEALATEVPVVATNVGSVSESVVDGETGFLVPSEDLDQFAEQVGELLGNAELRIQLGRAGRVRVIKNGSLESMVSGYEKLILDGYASKLGLAFSHVDERVEELDFGKSNSSLMPSLTSEVVNFAGPLSLIDPVDQSTLVPGPTSGSLGPMG